jgi:hypothetical protein
MNDEPNKSPPRHAPVPWKVKHNPRSRTLSMDNYPIESADLKRIVIVHGSSAETAANAAFIVHACNHHYELIAGLERAIDILKEMADKLLYEEGLPVTFLESREIEDIYNDAICELAPFETLIRKARGQA